MNVFAHVEASIAEALQALKAEGVLPADVAIPRLEAETPRDASHGDMASNAAMVLAKAARMKPRDIADKLKDKLVALPGVAAVEVAGPGFLNIRFEPRFWQDHVRAILDAGRDYGRGAVGNGERVNVEYVSANPTGPMHVGHCRGAVFGDALANLLAFAGYDVTREYYVNDAGGQIETLVRSVYLRYREALGEDIGAIPDGLYPGDYLKPVGEALRQEHGRTLLLESDPSGSGDNADDRAKLAVIRKTAIEAMMAMIREDLAALDIRHDVFFFESSLSSPKRSEVFEAIEDLRAKGHIYEGRLEKPKGHDDGEWEDREQTLFKSTAFGDDVDRALMKSDGSYTYFAGDVAYHHNKLGRGFRHLVNVFGADHIGYIPRMLAMIAAFTGGKPDLKKWCVTGGSADFEIKVVQLVKLYKNGEPYKMSKRAGTFVTLRDVVDEVGRDPVRFMMLYRKELEPLDFDFAKVTEQSKDNPVFYVQYAHARCASIFRMVLETFPDFDRTRALAGADTSLLTDPGELTLIKQLAVFPKLTTGAAAAHEPHRLAFYLYDLASSFHAQWTRGNDSPHLRFIQAENRGTTSARLALVAATQQVISSGLALLGVQAPEAMR